jgi:hypothetical protein
MPGTLYLYDPFSLSAEVSRGGWTTRRNCRGPLQLQVAVAKRKKRKRKKRKKKKTPHCLVS